MIWKVYIKIKNDYVYFMGSNEVLHIPINGAIIDLDYENFAYI
jgi:hypothetical protein